MALNPRCCQLQVVSLWVAQVPSLSLTERIILWSDQQTVFTQVAFKALSQNLSVCPRLRVKPPPLSSTPSSCLSSSVIMKMMILWSWKDLRWEVGALVAAGAPLFLPHTTPTNAPIMYSVYLHQYCTPMHQYCTVCICTNTTHWCTNNVLCIFPPILHTDAPTVYYVYFHKYCTQMHQ